MDCWILFQVDVRVWMAIARQELFDAKGVGRIAGTNERYITDSLRQQLRPAKNEGAHQDFAELSVGLHKGDDFVPSNFDNFSILPRTNTCDRTASRKRVEFASELAWPEDPD